MIPKGEHVNGDEIPMESAGDKSCLKLIEFELQVRIFIFLAMPAILLFSSILWLFMDWRGLLGVLFQKVHIRKSCQKSRPGWFKIQ